MQVNVTASKSRPNENNIRFGVTRYRMKAGIYINILTAILVNSLIGALSGVYFINRL